MAITAMPRRNHTLTEYAMRRFASWLAGCTMLAVSFTSAVWAADNEIRIVPSQPTVQSAVLNDLLRRGQKLETDGKWGEALTLYEDALRDYPGEQALAGRHDLAKMHYDIGRRYSDNSYRRAVTVLREREALALYSEVLLKVQSHYVSEPNWHNLVARGTADVDLAVNEAPFAKMHLSSVLPEQIASFRQQLARQMQSRQIRSRQDAVDAVMIAGRIAQNTLSIMPTTVILEYACAASGALDEYSSYLTSDQLNDVYSQIEGNFVGLGIELKSNSDSLLIVKVITGSPAERGGLRGGDRITSVNGRSTLNLSTDQAADLLQGPEGSTVRITAVGPNQQPREMTIKREHVDVPSVDDVKMVDAASGVAYLKLTCFQKTTSRDLDAALWKLHRDGMRTLIMDLRGNPGGLLTTAVEVVDKFVEDGTIVSTRGRSSMEDYTYTAHRPGTWRVPLVVLIDGDSASASEIFAGAIRDHHRGTIVGQRSYGKGSVQGIFPLGQAGAGLRLTTAKFYSPSGRPISRVGVDPDVAVQRVARPIDGEVEPSGDEQDLVLAAGIQAAQQQVAKR